MKKLAAVILSIVYLGTSAGATVHLHYCMGKLAGWSLNGKQSQTCGSCGMQKDNKEHKDCCQDEQRFIKNSDDQKAAESSFQLLEITGTTVIPAYAELPSIKLSSVTEENPVSNAPPRSNRIAVYILNRTFLI